MHSPHPDETLLLDCARGVLAPAARIVVRAHAEHCARCRQNLVLLEDLGGALLQGLSHTRGPSATSTSAYPPASRRRSAADGPSRVGETILPASAAGVEFHPRRWFAPGVWTARAHLPATQGWALILLHVPAGRGLPRHGHEGPELVTVLSGAYEDRDQVFSQGEFALNDIEDEHDLRAIGPKPCVCLVASSARLRWMGASRWLQPILPL